MAKRSTNWLTQMYLYHFKECFDVALVERQTGPVKQDCFGFADFVGVNHDQTYWVQSTSYTNVSSRLRKVQENITALSLVGRGDIVLVLGWKYLEGKMYHLREEQLKIVLSQSQPEYISQRINIGEEDLLKHK